MYSNVLVSVRFIAVGKMERRGPRTPLATTQCRASAGVVVVRSFSILFARFRYGMGNNQKENGESTENSS